MHELEIILTITGCFTAALLFGYLTQRLGLSPIVGYLLAGVAVGPHTPGFVANRLLAEQLAEIGVILLMFGVGLQFHFKELLAVRRVALPGAIGQSAVATLLGCLLARGVGWSWPAGIVFGLAVSVASTVVLLRVLVDNNDLHTPTGHIAVGWLVVEDLFTVFLLVMLPAILGTGAAAGSLPIAIALCLLKIALLITLVFLVGGRLIPWLLDRVAATRSRELFTLTVLVLALGVAVGSAELFGVSMGLGAFLAGMVVRQSEFGLRAASEALPMRDAFAVLFFVSVGMLFDPAHLVNSPGLVAATLAIILLGKPLVSLAIVLALGHAPHVALSVAASLAQIGEFSFILATVGRNLGILGESGVNTLVAASIISISLNPLLYRLVQPVEKRARQSRIWRRLTAGKRPLAGEDSAGVIAEEPISRDRAVVVGYGPTGRTVARLLEENGIAPVIVELNLATVRALRAQGLLSIYGDATHREALQEAGVAGAVALILTSAGMHGSEEVIRLARELNPGLRVIARAGYLRDIPALRRVGADAVFSGEGEVALNMTELILRQLGATPEQIDRERERLRAELFGDQVPTGTTDGSGDDRL